MPTMSKTFVFDACKIADKACYRGLSSNGTETYAKAETTYAHSFQP